MKTTPEEYLSMTRNTSPKSKLWKDMFWAFISGGIICVIGQFFCNLYLNYGITLKDSRTLSSVTLVIIGALLTSMNVYNKIAKHAGAGTLLPITGFANSIAAPAVEFKSEGHILGVGAKMFTIAGPVLVFGISSSVIYGIIVFIFKLY